MGKLNLEEGLIRKELDLLLKVRDDTLTHSRDLIRLSSNLINSYQNLYFTGIDDTETDKIIWALKETKDKMLSLLKDYPRIRYNRGVDDALQEYCEAMIFISLIKEADIPSMEKLDVDAVPYLMGLCDVVGELRRHILNLLRIGEMERSERFLIKMENLYHFIQSFHYPKSIVAVKRKKDVARSLLDKTLGEVVVAKVNLTKND